MKLVKSQATTPTIKTVQTVTEMTAALGCDRHVRMARRLPATQTRAVWRWRPRPRTIATTMATAITSATLQCAADASRVSCPCQTDSAMAPMTSNP